LYKLREACEGNIVFMGHVDILAWNEDRIRLEIERAKKKFIRGGLILGSSCGISKKVSLNKISALYPEWHSVD